MRQRPVGARPGRDGGLHGHRRDGPALVAALAAGFLASGCLPQSATVQSRGIADLYVVFLAIGAVVMVAVYGPLTWSILRHRRRDDTLPEQVRGNARLEFIWTAIPAVTVVALFVLTFMALARADAAPTPETETGGGGVQPGAQGGQPLALAVEAFRWGWTFSYPNEGITMSGVTGTAPEIVVPVGQPVQVTLTAADVEHAFYVPAFLFKRDAVPGRPSTFFLTVERPGYYGGQCAEFCGTYHSQMPFGVRAVPPAEFASWLQTQRGTQP